jgi:integrase/recombinase XerC
MMNFPDFLNLSIASPSQLLAGTTQIEEDPHRVKQSRIRYNATHTRRAYAHAVAGFMTWCDANRVGSITDVQPLHVAAWIEQQTREHAAPTAKLRLAALRHLFDWLVIDQVLPTNPAGSVRGPAHVVKVGKTPVLAPEEARALIDRIAITTPVGLRGRR